MTELLPCPFCGGEAELVEGEYGMYLVGYAIYCKGTCGAKLGVTGRLCEAYEWTPYFDSEAEAIAAWNTRYHSEFEKTVIKAWKEIKDYTERTCKPVEKDGVMRCPNCDYPLGIMSVPAYCAGCGAKVVSE